MLSFSRGHICFRSAVRKIIFELSPKSNIISNCTEHEFKILGGSRDNHMFAYHISSAKRQKRAAWVGEGLFHNNLKPQRST